MAEVTIEDKAKEPVTQEPQLFQYGDATYKLDDIIKAAKQDYNKRYYYSMLDTKSVNGPKLNDAINTMIQGLNEKWIGYNPNSGNFVIYGDHKDITNDPEHYYGMASWYLKHIIIQDLTPYDKEKEEEKEAIKHGKVKYEGLESLQNYFRKQLVGNGLTKQNFINLDEYNSETGTRAVTNRTARVNTAIQKMIDEFNDYFYGYTEKQKNQAISELEELQKKINDENTTLDKNEFSDFERVLGANLSKDESNPITWRELFNTTWNGKSTKLDDTTEYYADQKRKTFNKWFEEQGHNDSMNYKEIIIDLNGFGTTDGPELDTESQNYVNRIVEKILESKNFDKNTLFKFANGYLTFSDFFSDIDLDQSQKAKLTNIAFFKSLLTNNRIKQILKDGIVQNNIKMIYDEKNKKIHLYWIGKEKNYLKKEFDKWYVATQKQGADDNTEDYYSQYYAPEQSVAQKKEEEEEEDNDEQQES